MSTEAVPLSCRAAAPVQLLLETARPLILSRFEARSCIASTRIAVEYLREQGVRARPVSVRLRIYNPAYTARLIAAKFDDGFAAELARMARSPESLAAAGLWSIGIGYSRDAGETIAPSAWDGHLVCVVEDRAILDLSLDQGCRPAHNIELGPALIPTNRVWLAGECGGEVIEHGCLLAYTALPADRTFLASPDWRETRRWAGVLKDLRAASRSRVRAA